MLDNKYYRGLPPAVTRPAWCRSTTPDGWWLPWQAALIVSAASVEAWELTGSGLARAAGISGAATYRWIVWLEHLGLLESAWEDEVHPDLWAARVASGTVDADGPRRRYYATTDRGRFWLATLPVQNKPDLLNRPGFWVGAGLLLVAVWLIGVGLG